MSLPIWVLIGAAIVACLVWLMKPDRRVQANGPLTEALLRACFETLLYRGLDEGAMKICSDSDTERLRFTKYVRPNGEAGIATEISYDPSNEVFRNELTEHEVKHVVGSSTSAGEVMRFDFGHDIDQAQFVTRLLFEHVLGFKLAVDGIAYFNEKILPTDVPRLTGAKRQER